MFGMNEKDALAAMEEAAFAKNVFNAQSARIGYQEDQSSWALATKLLEERKLTIQRLSHELKEVAHQRNSADANAYGSVDALKAVIHELACATGQDEQALARKYNIHRTQRFNIAINRMAAEGAFLRDPRTELSNAQKNWYVPGLDPEHGF